MEVRVLDHGEFVPIGSIRYIDGKVVFFELEKGALEDFRRVYWVDRWYYPKEGLAYMNAVKDYYGRSYAVDLGKEKEDVTWLV